MSAVTVAELTLADDPASWQRFGFDVQGGLCGLGTVAVRLAGNGAGKGILRWALRGANSTQLDGLPTELSREQQAGAPSPVHPNGVARIDHIVAVSPSFERSVHALQQAGLDLRRIREEPTPAGAPRQAFFRLGDEILELVSEPAQVAERAGGEDRDAFFWGLALLCRDLDRTAAAFGEHVGAVRPAVQSGRRIATVKRSAGLCVPVALMSIDENRVPAA